MTVTTSGDTANLSISSLPGTCPGTINGDRATWSCQLTTSSGTVTLQVAATFTGSGVSGTVVLGGSCQVSENFTGTKQ